MGVMASEDVTPTGTATYTSSIIVLSTRATIGTAATVTTTSRPTSTDSAADHSLWAELYASGKAGKLAAGIDALLGLVLVVFFAVIIYQWRKRSGGGKEVSGPVCSLPVRRHEPPLVAKGESHSSDESTPRSVSPCSERSVSGNGDADGDGGRKVEVVVVGGK